MDSVGKYPFGKLGMKEAGCTNVNEVQLLLTKHFVKIGIEANILVKLVIFSVDVYHNPSVDRIGIDITRANKLNLTLRLKISITLSVCSGNSAKPYNSSP